MLASKSLLTRPIVSLEEGQKIGTVRGLIVDPKAMEVVALQVDQKGLFREQKVIPFSKVHSIGEAAIIVDKANQVQKATNLPQLFQLFKEKIAIIGNKVLTTEGEKIGIVNEYYLDRYTGKIISIELRGSFGDNWFQNKAVLPARSIRTISQNMILVHEASLTDLAVVENPVEETFKKASEKTGHFWDSTVLLSKEWSEKLSQSWEKFSKGEKRGDSTGSLFYQEGPSGQAPTQATVNLGKYKAGEESTQVQPTPSLTENDKSLPSMSQSDSSDNASSPEVLIISAEEEKEIEKKEKIEKDQDK
ncbi:PRC-barrel domain-containing protein [Heliorestis convoluta]|uniref:PRC-barrel domain protein n=1 Tax=Heliorestis convoluta TaxID=356322 RepID=A0A5Q2N334_9FIRM|nr:PRC-barrel domain-containing protein [Heliorestis convoluta]QGG48701.1 PRC-barrel domain protein [Heliorestis convoluta]